MHGQKQKYAIRRYDSYGLYDIIPAVKIILVSVIRSSHMYFYSSKFIFAWPFNGNIDGITGLLYPLTIFWSRSVIDIRNIRPQYSTKNSLTCTSANARHDPSIHIMSSLWYLDRLHCHTKILHRKPFAGDPNACLQEKQGNRRHSYMQSMKCTYIIFCLCFVWVI